MASGRAMRVDYEYVRQGTASAFMFTEALRGWRKVSVRARRTAVDWAEEVKGFWMKFTPMPSECY